MPDPFDPTLGQLSPDGQASAHVDASTIALLAEVGLDAAAIAELVRFLLDDDPDLPSVWHLAPLLMAAEHVESCPVCDGVRVGIVGAAVAALSGALPAVTVPTRDAHLAAALAAFDGSIARGPTGGAEARSAGLGARTRRPWLRPRTTRAGLGVGQAAGSTSGRSPSSNWAFVRDRRVLLAVAVVLAISVPLVVNGGRRNRPDASKSVETTTTPTTVADTTAAAADTTAAAARSKAAGSTGGVATQAEGESTGNGIAQSDTTSASADQAASGAAPVIASADPGASASASAIAVPAATPSVPLASVSTTPTTPTPTVAPLATPVPSTKSPVAPVAAKRSVVSTARPSDAALAAAATTVPAAARSGVLASADTADSAGSKPIRDLGTLGSFTDEEAALVAFAATGSTAPTGALAAKVPAPGTGEVSAPAAAAPAVSGADGRCVRALIGADTVARADINGVAVLIVSFSEPFPGHVQLLTADGCVVRLDRTR